MKLPWSSRHIARAHRAVVKACIFLGLLSVLLAAWAIHSAEWLLAALFLGPLAGFLLGRLVVYSLDSFFHARDWRE